MILPGSMLSGIIKINSMGKRVPLKIKRISELLQLRGLPATRHPLISVINIAELKQPPENADLLLCTDFYFIGMSAWTQSCIKMPHYDFDKGVMNFIAPGRVFSFNVVQQEMPRSGWLLLLHPDFLLNYPGLKRYEFFDYAVNEALFLSEEEEQIVNGLFANIQREYSTNIDTFSRGIIISLIESLMKYAERFYQRQFITREVSHHSIVHQLGVILEAAFSREVLEKNGVPTVKDISGQLNLSPNYLSGVLKTLTGSSTQQHIQEKIIAKAKERLVMTDLSVNEIAFELGFEYPQSFSKLFRTRVKLSPLEFRKAERFQN